MFARFRGGLAALRKVFERPRLFDPTGESFWRDPYMSDHILRAHLDPATDDASRRRVTIERSARWIRSLLPSGARLLDLGCGPGLYCEAFADLGLRVTGVDYSAKAIGYARERAASRRAPIEYRLADYRSTDFVGAFDAVTMIYGGFGVLSNVDRDGILGAVRRALKPGGLFIFDVFTRRYIEDGRGGWYLRGRDGFWSSRPHLLREQKFDYPGEDVHVDRYVVVEWRGSVKVFNLWKHYYSAETIQGVLREAGFSVEGLYGDLTGAEASASGEWIGLVARPKRIRGQVTKE